MIRVLATIFSFVVLTSITIVAPVHAITKVTTWQCPDPAPGKQMALFALANIDIATSLGVVAPYNDKAKSGMLQYCVELDKGATAAPFSAFSPVPFAMSLNTLSVTKEKTSCSNLDGWDNIGSIASFDFVHTVTELCKNFVGSGGVMGGDGIQDKNIDKHVRYNITNSANGNTWYLYFVGTKVSTAEEAATVGSNEYSCTLFIEGSSNGKECKVDTTVPFPLSKTTISIGEVISIIETPNCEDRSAVIAALDGSHGEEKELGDNFEHAGSHNGYVYKLTCVNPSKTPDLNVGGAVIQPSGTSNPSNYVLNTDDYKRPENYDGPLPDCAFDGSCRDVNDLLLLGVNAANILLSFIGTFAFAFFVYGGITMILSMGSPERVKKGRDILVAAVVGIIIAFSAYALINFTLDALQVSDDFRVISNS